MAYKIQIGNATYSGSITQTVGDFDAGSSDVSGSDISSGGDIDIDGKLVLTTGGIQLKNANTVAQSIKIKDGANSAVIIGNAPGNLDDGTQLELLDATAVVLEVGVDPNGNKITGHTAGCGYVLIKDRAGTPATHMEIEGASGDVSGSGDLKIGGNLEIGGNLVIGGDFTESDNQDDPINLPAFSTTDATLELKHEDGAGIRFGTNGVGGGIFVAQGASAWSGSVALSASAWYGNGAQLTGISTSGLALTTGELVNGATAAIGHNVYSGNANIAIDLPAVRADSSEVASGAQIIIKNNASADVNVTVSRAASDGAFIKIDGEQAITLHQGASVKCILSASADNQTGGWLIF